MKHTHVSPFMWARVYLRCVIEDAYMNRIEVHITSSDAALAVPDTCIDYEYEATDGSASGTKTWQLCPSDPYCR